MIFKNKIINLPDGDNLTLFAIDENHMNLYLKKDEIRKKKITLGNIVRCESLESLGVYDCVYELENDCLGLCFGGNMSVVKKENLS